MPGTLFAHHLKQSGDLCGMDLVLFKTSKYFLTIFIIETKINYSKGQGTLSTGGGDEF